MAPPAKSRALRVLRLLASVFGGAAAIGLVRYFAWLAWYKRAQSRKRAPLLPGPTPYPLIGNLVQMARVISFGSNGMPQQHKMTQKLAAAYDGIYALVVGDVPLNPTTWAALVRGASSMGKGKPALGHDAMPTTLDHPTASTAGTAGVQLPLPLLGGTPTPHLSHGHAPVPPTPQHGCIR